MGKSKSSAPKSHPTAGRLPFLLSGALTLLAYPPINLWLVSWFSLLPLIVKARDLPFWLAFRRGWWAGLIFNAGLLYWIALNSGANGIVAPASFLGLLLIVPLYWAAFTAFWAFLYRRWGDGAALLLPALWVALEVVKNAPEIAFPWSELGLSQINLLPAAQIAEWGGIRLVSAWVMLVNVSLYLLFRKRQRAALFAIALVALALLWGDWRITHLPPAGERLNVLIVQGNVDPEAKWQDDPDSSLNLYVNLTRAAAKQQHPDLVLWPETAIPAYLGYQVRYQMRLRQLAREVAAPLLTGAPHYELVAEASQRYKSLNSAFFFPADGSPPQRYDKIHLVPFGERVPFQKWIPSLGELNFGQAEFTAGREFTVFELADGLKCAAAICFESVFGDETRHFILNGARVLTNLTNDGWYGNSSGPYQHAALVRFRAIETRCPLFRAANTGVSLGVDRAGRVAQSLAYNRQGVLWVNLLAGSETETFYVRHGELLPRLLSLIAMGGLLLAAVWQSKRTSV